MRYYLTDRGIQAAITSGVVLATLAIFTTEYRPLWVALGVAWVAAAAFAVVVARNNRSRQ